jgi:hypothetical protein
MPAVLHLLKADSPPLARTVIARQHGDAGETVTVVLLDGAADPGLPAGVTVRRLAPGDLDYAGLLDLIFDHDHVVTW